MKRLYTVEAATRTLPYVTGIVAEVRERYRRLRKKGGEHNAVPAGRAERRNQLKAEIRQEAARLKECQEELLELGAILKDYELGLVDFPAELDGRQILLCWEFGEPEVAFWHEAFEGAYARQPVPDGVPQWPAVSVSPAAPE